MGDRDENRGVALYHRKTAARRVSLSETRLVFGVLRRTTRFPDSDATPALSARASKFPLQQQHFRRRPQRYPVCFLLVVYAHHRFPRRSPRPRLRYDTCSHPPAWRCASTSAISPSRMRATRGLGAPTAVRLVRECRRCAMPSSASYTVSPLGGRSGRHACLHSSSRPSAADLKTPCPPHPLRGVRRRAATVWHPLPAATRCPPGVEAPTADCTLHIDGHGTGLPTISWLTLLGVPTLRMMLVNPNVLCLLVGLAGPTLAVTQPNLTVKVRTGTFVGNLNDTYPDVRQFKYIPYAKPPVGPLRWMPPQRLDDSSQDIDSTTFGPSCSQYVTAVPSAWALNITGNLIVNYGESLLAGQVAQNSAEDCLTLAIWTPANASANSKLPVIHFLTGGGDVTGGVNIPTQLPANWVHNSQAHIVVTTNYRVNIFSYPNARGLNGMTNFGLRDQRAAVEWVAENIATFGGDPRKITLWGQSAGASATDMYLFAYHEDPIIRASVSSSGEAIGHAQNPDIATGSNFTFVAKALGCDFEDAALELECMRRIPMPRIENFVGQYQDNSTLVDSSQPAIAFTRAVDNVTVFANYTERYLQGQIAKLPKIIGTTAREASALVPYPIHDVAAGPNETLVVASTLATVCAAHNTTVLRNELDLPTFRYEWGGNFSDLTGGVAWLGAYHYSDLYMFFGSYLINPLPPADPLEASTSRVMQDFLLDFVNDPTSLPRSGWPEYRTGAEDGGQIAQFGADEQAFKLVSGESVEAACHIPGAVYNTTP